LAIDKKKQKIKKNKVYLPSSQKFTSNSINIKLEKIIYTQENRITDIDAIKYGKDKKEDFIEDLKRSYRLEDGVYLTFFEYENYKN